MTKTEIDELIKCSYRTGKGPALTVKEIKGDSTCKGQGDGWVVGAKRKAKHVGDNDDSPSDMMTMLGDVGHNCNSGCL